MSLIARAYAAVAARKRIATAADGSCVCTAAASIERMFKWIKKKEIKPAMYGLHY